MHFGASLTLFLSLPELLLVFKLKFQMLFLHVQLEDVVSEARYLFFCFASFFNLLSCLELFVLKAIPWEPDDLILEPLEEALGQ